MKTNVSAGEMKRRRDNVCSAFCAVAAVFAALTTSARASNAHESGASPGEYDLHTRALTPIEEKAAPAGGPMKFVENGELRFAIVTDDAKRDEKALELLREVFAKTVGREPSVLSPTATNSLPFSLVLAQDAALPPEGFSIKTSPRALTISGHVYFGALDFAERFLGVRWYFPGEYGCIYPKRRDFTVSPVWYEDAPYFMSRGNRYGMWVSVRDKAQVEKWRPYMGEIKARDTSFADRWRTGGTLPAGGSHNPFPEKIAASHPDKLKTIFYTSPHGKFWYNPKAHAGNIYNVFDLGFADLLVEDWKYYLDSGRKKSADRGGFKSGVNDTFVTFGLCDTYLPLGEAISHPVVKELGLVTDKDLAREKDAALANVYARFFQYLGRKVEKELPGKRLFLLCYYNSKCPSLDPRWKLPDNVEVNVCDERMPLRIRSPRHLEGLRQLFREWYEALGGRPVLKAWLYSGGTPFGRSVGPEFVGELPRALGKYLGRGGIYYDFTTPTDLWHYYYSAYVAWRSQWNPDLDVGAAIDEMWNLCLGPKAGAKMKVFHDELKAAFVKYQAGDDNGWLAPTYPVAVIDRLEGLLKETEALIEPGSVEMKRFKLVADFWPEPFEQQRRRALYEPPVYDVRRLAPEEVPTIDGSPDDRVWAEVKSMPLIDRFSGAPKPEVGSVKLAWDDKGLYAAFETGAGAPKTGCSIWLNSAIEFFLSQGLGKEVLYQLVFDAEENSHLQRQRLLPIPQPKDLTWKAEGHVYKARSTASGWTAELFVPFSAFEDGAPKVYDSWNFNFATTDRSCKPSVSASTSLTGLAHGNLAMYGIIRFSGKGD